VGRRQRKEQARNRQKARKRLTHKFEITWTLPKAGIKREEKETEKEMERKRKYFLFKYFFV
jgi:hypothetical protein